MNGIGSDNAASLDIRWVSKFVEWGLQGILRCRCWGVAVKVRNGRPVDIMGQRALQSVA